MKVLQINVVYKVGSTGKITYAVHKDILAAGMESVVCYGRGSLVKEPGGYKTCPEWYSKLNNAWSRITGMMYGGCFFSTNRLIQIIKKRTAGHRPFAVHQRLLCQYVSSGHLVVDYMRFIQVLDRWPIHIFFSGGRYGKNSCGKYL